MKLDYKLIIILGLSIVIYFIYREVNTLFDKLLVLEKKVKLLDEPKKISDEIQNEVINNDKYKYTLKIIKFCECGSNTTKYISREQDIINFLCDEFFYRYQEYCGDVEADIYSVIKKLMFLMSQYNLYDDYNTWNDRQYILSKQTVSGFFLSKSQEYRKNIKIIDLFELC